MAPQAPARSRCLSCSDPRFLLVTFGLLGEEQQAEYGHFKEMRLSCCSSYVTFPSGAMIELLPRDYSTHSLNPTEAGKGPGVRLRNDLAGSKGRFVLLGGSLDNFMLTTSRARGGSGFHHKGYCFGLGHAGTVV